MQESRLFKIVYHLLSCGHSTAPELARLLEVSVRTIYRDLDALSAANIPIYTETGRGGGIYLMPGFTLDSALFSAEEKQEILSALQSLGAVQGGSSAALDKLSAIFSTGNADWLEVDFSGWGSSGGNEKFAAIKAAILQHRALDIIYSSSYGKTTARRVYPLKLAYKAHAWYLRAYCTQKRACRTFKLSRILRYTAAEEVFAPMPCPQTEEPQRQYAPVTLRFARALAYLVYDEFDPEYIAVQADGCYLVTAPLPQDAWLVGFLLGCGTQVEIISPPALRRAVAQQAKEIYEYICQDKP